jgi:hypothetical protein
VAELGGRVAGALRRQRVQPAPRNRHGLTPAEVTYLLDRQQHRCPICMHPLPPDWVIDHDHALAAEHGHQGKEGCKRCVRAIIDRTCNALLGAARDDPAVLRRAANYVELARENHR